MMHYTLSRLLDDGDEHTSATFTERDPVNAAHLIAAYFNTVNRPMLNGAALAVVFSDGRVQYDGKSEQIKRAEPSKYAHMNRGERSEHASHVIVTTTHSAVIRSPCGMRLPMCCTRLRVRAE